MSKQWKDLSPIEYMLVTSTNDYIIRSNASKEYFNLLEENTLLKERIENLKECLLGEDN